MNNNYDIIIIGGGATGLGCAVEAASRGYSVLVLEAYDYGKGTSSKSTKLVHGGIRYLANFDFALVQEGLEERYYFLNNMPHLAKAQSYLIPLRNWREKIKYWLGIKLYNFLAGKRKIGANKFLDKKQTLEEAKDLSPENLGGSAIYLDGQFDDTRVLISLVKTLEQLGGSALNYHKVTSFNETNGMINGVHVLNQLDNSVSQFNAKVVINATGTFGDSLIDLAEPQIKHQNITAAQGTHLVFDKEFFDSSHAILVPETSDGRVLFILPWHNKIIVGTTDIKMEYASLEPQATEQEIEFIIDTFNGYSKNQVTRQDIRAIFCGQRPLVKSPQAKNTAKISRKHEIFNTKNGLITIVGGKWTIYRRMGQDTIDFIEKHLNWPKTISQTASLHLFGYTKEQMDYPLVSYGSEAKVIHQLQMELNNYQLIHPMLPYLQAEVIYHTRYEQAKTVEDVLARRTRAIFLDTNAAIEASSLVATLMAQELGYPKTWEQQQVADFKIIAAKFMPPL